MRLHSSVTRLNKLRLRGTRGSRPHSRGCRCQHTQQAAAPADPSPPVICRRTSVCCSRAALSRTAAAGRRLPGDCCPTAAAADCPAGSPCRMRTAARAEQTQPLGERDAKHILQGSAVWSVGPIAAADCLVSLLTHSVTHRATGQQVSPVQLLLQQLRLVQGSPQGLQQGAGELAGTLAAQPDAKQHTPPFDASASPQQEVQRC